MKKYIIKNCPAMDDQARCMAGHIITCNYLKECEFITTCLLKKIAETCGYASPDGGFNDSEAQDLANEILELLDIEEC